MKRLDRQTTCTRPKNLHVAAGVPGSELPALAERVEQKFFVTPQNHVAALALLRRCCRAEAMYGIGQVNSLYFDTPDLDQHERSIEGEFAKDKIRIRWYGQEHDPHRSNGRDHGQAEQAVAVWLERKSRQGFASTKQRLCLDVPATRLDFRALQDGIVEADTLVRTMARFGFVAPGRLGPVVAISYWRYRFVEPESGYRISIDSRIRSSMVVPGIGAGERALELPGAVVEVKGAAFGLPRSLRQLSEIGSSWTRYSKYSSSLDAHQAERGSVSRLWPSGVLGQSLDVMSRVVK